MNEISTTAQCWLGFDTATYVDDDHAKQFLAAGYRFVARYLGRMPAASPPAVGGPALSRQEAETLLTRGLAIVPVQFGKSTLVPTVDEGTSAGAAAAHNAQLLGIPAQVTLWCDLEWTPDMVPDPGATKAYANAWFDAVRAAGYEPGVYVGPNVPLSADELYQSLKFTHYWKSAARVPWPPSRGYQILQGYSLKQFDLAIDPDLVVLDAQEDTFTWWACA
jgi:hypothetical protein